MVQRGLQEKLRRGFVLPGGQLCETSCDLEFSHDGLIVVLAVNVGKVRCVFGFCDVRNHVVPALQVNGNFEHVPAHVDDVFAAGAVVPGSGVTLEGIVQVAAVEVVVAKVVVTSSDALLDGVALVVFEVGVKLFEFEGGLLRTRVDPCLVDCRVVLGAGLGCDVGQTGCVESLLELLVKLHVEGHVVRCHHVGDGEFKSLNSQGRTVVRNVDQTIELRMACVTVCVRF